MNYCGCPSIFSIESAAVKHLLSQPDCLVVVGFNDDFKFASGSHWREECLYGMLSLPVSAADGFVIDST